VPATRLLRYVIRVRDIASRVRQTRGMSGSLTEAQKRLPSLADLNQVAGLLNIPGLDDAERNVGAPLHLQQAALLTRIADWAGLAARAARETGDMDLSQVTDRYAYLIETVDEHQSGWWQDDQADSDGGGIEESHDSAETFALAVLDRYLEHLRSRLNDDEDAIADQLRDEFHVRVSVWRVDAATASYSAPRPDSCPPDRYGRVLKASRISPQAVEIRTPFQVRRHLYGGGVGI
jgi:hypothetical protein